MIYKSNFENNVDRSNHSHLQYTEFYFNSLWKTGCHILGSFLIEASRENSAVAS